MRKWAVRRVGSRLGAMLTILLLGGRLEAQPPPAPVATPAPPAFVPGEVLVKFKSNVAPEAVLSALGAARLQSVQHLAAVNVHRCRVPDGMDVQAAIEACKADAAIAYAEPNYIYTASRLPNDPRFGELWGLNNANDVDVDAPEAWDAQTGVANVLVAIIDTGVDYNHEDLRANAWKNPGESGAGRETNGRDDDNNGFVDDVRGWDFAGDDNDPMDDNGHGTHVAGTIAAAGDNGIGVAGVNWRAAIMALKFLSANGSGTAADAIECIEYAAQQGAQVLNNSWGGGGFSQALRDAIELARARNAVFVAAAGNEGRDNDASPSYPASYDVANVLSIAACDQQGQMASFSNFGRTSVDFAAPGVGILSTTPGNNYQSFSGTSMATPLASGVAALLLAQFPQSTYRQIMIRMAGSVDAAAPFEGTTWHGGRLNAAAALTVAPKVAFVTRWDNSAGPAGPYRVDAEALADGEVRSVSLSWAIGVGAPTVVAMTHVVDQVYRAEIPGQPMGTQLSYFVEAVDGGGATARSRTYTFQVGENAGTPPAGCGNLQLVSMKGTSGRVLVVLLNVLVVLVGLQVARKVSRRRAPAGWKH